MNIAELTEREQQILAFEKGTWRYAGAKETAIRDLFDCSSHRYYQETQRADRQASGAGR